MEVEEYDTVLRQVLYKEVTGSESPRSIGLQSQGSEKFNLYENIYYEVEASHEYGTEVKVKIYVIEAKEEGEQYYTISKAELNGEELKITEEEGEEVGGSRAKVYSFRYTLRGDNLPTTMDLAVSFKALYFVNIG